MLDTVDKLPDDPSILKEMISSLASELTNRDAELQSRDILIEKLKHQLAGLCRHQFGSRSESLDQLELTLEEEEIARAAEAPARQDRILPGHLRRKVYKAGCEPPQPINPVTSIGYGLFDSGDNHTIPFVEALWKQEGRKLRVISRHFFLP